jgi:F-type H+-transporting ATPase subunit b
VNNPLVQPDPGLFIWTILTFLVLATVLAKFAWKPMLQALERRQQMVAKAVEDARLAAEELKRRQAETESALAAARAEAEAIVSRSLANAERLRVELQQKASADAATILRNAERQIEIETNRALEVIRAEAVNLSIAVAEKILRRSVSKEDHAPLIAESIQQISGKRQ